MSDQLDQAHAAVALDLLGAYAPLSGLVYDGVVPNETPLPQRYVLVYSVVSWLSTPDAAAASLGHASDTCLTTWYLHCVGRTGAAARAMTSLVRQALLDKAPITVPAGRACDPIGEDDANPPIRDESLGTAVMDAVLVMSMLSVPG